LPSRDLDLSFNRLSGTLPQALSLLTALTRLKLCGNRLRGDAPSWLTSLPLLASPGVTLAQCGQTVSECLAGFVCSPQSLSVAPQLCPAGYVCGPGSTRAAAGVCPKGSYCPAGSSAAQPCPRGTYGNTTGLQAPQCSGVCPPKFYCPSTGHAPPAVAATPPPCLHIPARCRRTHSHAHTHTLANQALSLSFRTLPSVLLTS
jgi:hypothetical protein